MGWNGWLIIVVDGFYLGSEVVNMLVLGYNFLKVYEGCGLFEVVSIGVDLQLGEMVMCCNLICMEGDILKNYLVGYIIIEEVDVLI